MKKKLGILMAVVMAFTMLTGCVVGGSASGEKTEYYWLTDMTQYREGSGTVNREQISADDPRVAAAFTYEEIAPYITVNENFEASLTLPDEMWIDNDGVRTVCILKIMEDPLGKNYEIYECENHPKELAMILYDVEMSQYEHLYGTAGNQTPVVDGTTPDGGASGQTPAPAPEPAPEPAPAPTPTYSYPFMGKYFIAVVNYGSPSQQYVNYGMYIDETTIYYNDCGQIFTEPLAAYIFEDRGNGNYTYSTDSDYPDGFSYYAANEHINTFSGGYDGYLYIPVDKAVYDAIGSY